LGQATIYGNLSETYRVVLKSSNGLTTYWTQDGVAGDFLGTSGYPCTDQMGWKFNENPTTGYTAHPAYFVGNTMNGALLGIETEESGYNNMSRFMVADREFYQAVSMNAQSNPTTPFNGTTGAGYGTLANRPTTCTQGVVYWATDQGNWNKRPGGSQGVLSRCESTNTWDDDFYTPYEYPHPLTDFEPAPYRVRTKPGVE
jgi:hypothetical protein